MGGKTNTEIGPYLKWSIWGKKQGFLYLRVDSALRRRRGSSKPACLANKNPNIPFLHTSSKTGRRHDRARRPGCNSGVSYWPSNVPSDQWWAPLLEGREDGVGGRGPLLASVCASVVADPAAICAWIPAEGMGWSQNLFRALRRALSKEAKQQVGTDQFGNKYYYVPEYKNWRGEMTATGAVERSVNKGNVRVSRKRTQRAMAGMSLGGTAQIHSSCLPFTLSWALGAAVRIAVCRWFVGCSGSVRCHRPLPARAQRRPRSSLLLGSRAHPLTTPRRWSRPLGDPERDKSADVFNQRASGGQGSCFSSSCPLLGDQAASACFFPGIDLFQ